jgi:hypothetical protein
MDGSSLHVIPPATRSPPAALMPGSSSRTLCSGSRISYTFRQHHSTSKIALIFLPRPRSMGKIARRPSSVYTKSCRGFSHRTVRWCKEGLRRCATAHRIKRPSGSPALPAAQMLDKTLTMITEQDVSLVVSLDPSATVTPRACVDLLLRVYFCASCASVVTPRGRGSPNKKANNLRTAYHGAVMSCLNISVCWIIIGSKILRPSMSCTSID